MQEFTYSEPQRNLHFFGTAKTKEQSRTNPCSAPDTSVYAAASKLAGAPLFVSVI